MSMGPPAGPPPGMGGMPPYGPPPQGPPPQGPPTQGPPTQGPPTQGPPPWGPPGSFGPPGPPPRKSNKGKVFIAALAAAAIGLAGGVVWAAVSPAAASTQVKLEAHATAGDNPFMNPVGRDEPTVTPPNGAAGTFSGATPGLYATGNKPSCDSGSLLSQLQSDGTRSAAWARALGIRDEDIPGYAQSLSPVLLRSDTAVTEHGYTPPGYNSYPAVLQAGTAVFVNSFGEPTVKCFSGNPLTRAGNLADAEYSGVRWSYFKPKGYTYVLPTRQVVNTYNYYDYSDHKIVIHESPCAKNPEAPGCKAPNPNQWCKDHPDDKVCKIEVGVSPGKGCTFDGKNWSCPAGADLKNPPAPGCTVNGDKWSCTPQIDPAKPIAAGCAAVGQEWQCTPQLDLTKNPKPNACQPGVPTDGTIPTHVWKCTFDPLNPNAPAAGCTLKDAGWECLPQPDPASPPGADCRVDGGKWVCPPPKGNPPTPDCKPAGTGWDCPAKTDTTTPPAEGCTLNADGKTWACPKVEEPAPPGEATAVNQKLAPDAQVCVQNGGDEKECQRQFAQVGATQGGAGTTGGSTGAPAGTTTGDPATTGGSTGDPAGTTAVPGTTGTPAGSTGAPTGTTGDPATTGATTGDTTGAPPVSPFSPDTGGTSTTGTTGTTGEPATSGGATTGTATTGTATTGGAPPAGTTGAPPAGTTGPPAGTTGAPDPCLTQPTLPQCGGSGGAGSTDTGSGSGGSDSGGSGSGGGESGGDGGNGGGSGEGEGGG